MLALFQSLIDVLNMANSNEYINKTYSPGTLLRRWRRIRIAVSSLRLFLPASVGQRFHRRFRFGRRRGHFGFRFDFGHCLRRLLRIEICWIFHNHLCRTSVRYRLVARSRRKSPLWLPSPTNPTCAASSSSFLALRHSFSLFARRPAICDSNQWFEHR